MDGGSEGPPVPLHPVVPVYPRNFSDPAEVAAERAALEADARNLQVHQRYLKQEAERVRARRLEVTSQMGKVCPCEIDRNDVIAPIYIDIDS